MIRTAWFLLNLFVSTTFFGSISIVAGIIRVPNKPGGVYDWCARRWAQVLLWASGAELRVVGLENIPPNQPVVYVSNHQSWFDIFTLAGRLPGQMRFVSKVELARFPVLGGAMRAAGHIFVDRQNRQAAFAAYESASSAIRNGLSATVFAEGTRSRTGELQPFKKGPFVLAIAAQVPVIPVYCAGTFTLLPKGTVRVDPHPIALMIGKPIPTADCDYEDRETLMHQTRAAVEQLRVDSEQVLGYSPAAGKNGE